MNTVGIPVLQGREDVKISCGVTVAHASDNIDGLLQRVDAALYAAKRGGGNRAAGIVDPNQPDTVEPARCEKAPVVQHVIAVRKRRARLAG